MHSILHTLPFLPWESAVNRLGVEGQLHLPYLHTHHTMSGKEFKVRMRESDQLV